MTQGADEQELSQKPEKSGDSRRRWIGVGIVPVVMGAGNRPFFGNISSTDVLLDNPTTCIQGDRVIHLVFPVSR